MTYIVIITNNMFVKQMEYVPTDVVTVITSYLPEVDKAFFSFTSKYFKGVVQRKYSLLASCVVDNKFTWSTLFQSWGNHWNKHECTALGCSPNTIIFNMSLQSFTTEQLEWIAYAVGYSNNPSAIKFFHIINQYDECVKKVFYPALIRGVIDSDDPNIWLRFGSIRTGRFIPSNVDMRPLIQKISSLETPIIW